MGICSVVQLQHKNVVMATMDLLKIVLKHLSLSFILHPKIPLIFFLHRSLIALYLRQDVCHLWQHVIKFRSPLMTPAGARIAQWWKLLFITRIKPVRFVFLTLAFYSFDSQCHPFKKALCPQIKKKKDRPFWTNDSQTCQNLWFKGRPDDASTRHSKTFTYLWTTHISEGIT